MIDIINQLSTEKTTKTERIAIYNEFMATLSIDSSVSLYKQLFDKQI